MIAIHGFPGMWWPHHPNWDRYHCWNGWNEKLASIAPQAVERPVWITETGLATWDLASQRAAKFDLQAAALAAAAAASAQRIYWYSLIDLDPARPSIEGFHVDENEYHMALVTHDLTRKPAFDSLATLLSPPSRS